MKPSSQPLSIASSLLLALTLTAGICSSSGQSGAATGPAPAQNGPPPQPAAVVLSPFEVQTSRDVGFVATSSLAGGRLAGDLKDTPAAYSVLTREFIDALGITDLTSASEWTVNSFSSPTNGSGEIFGATTEITTRGVSGGPQQRDFFPLNVNYDSYNLERFDFARGSNSILFGAGTFGGTANVVTKSARTDHSFENLQVTYGSWDNLRATLDVNVPIAKIGAVRVNALWSNRDGWRDFEREGKKAVTLGTTLKPLPHTELQFEGEFGIISRNMPGTYLNDQFTGWDGKTTFSTPLASAPSNANAVGVRLNGSTNAAYFVYAPGLNPGIINLGGTARTIGGNSGASTPVGGVLVVGPSANISANPYNFALNLPDTRDDVALANSHFHVPKSSFAMATNTPTSLQHYFTHTLVLRQQIGEHIFGEVAGNYSRERRENQYFNVRGLGDIILDINKNLPDGTPNPHFLDPYSEARRSRAYFTTESANVRAALAYAPAKTPWGEFIFNTFGGETWSRAGTRIQTVHVLRDADPRRWTFNDTVFYRYYFNDTSFPAGDIASANSTTGGVTSTYPAGWVNDSARETDISYSTSHYKYLQGASRANLFNDHLDLLGAVRFDTVFNDRRVNANYGDYPVLWGGETPYYRGKAPKDWAALSYTPKDANGNATGPARLADVRPRDSNRNPLPQYAHDRFQDDFNSPVVDVGVRTYSFGGVYHLNHVVSAFGNVATSFNPSGGGIMLDGNPVVSPVSRGVDYGLRFSLLHDRVMVSLDRYQGRESGQQVTSTINAAVNTIANANVTGDFSSDGRNARGLPDVLVQSADTRNRQDDGYELEGVANLTPAWRLSLNGALPHASQLNAFSQSRDYLAAHDTTLRQILADAGVLIDSNNVAAVDPSISGGRQSPDASAAAGAWNSLQTFKQTLVTGPQKIVGLVNFTANIFTDYRFREGFAKGFSIGGGANFRGEKIIGYRGSDTVVNPANPSTAIDDPRYDAYSVATAPSYTLVTGILGYTRRTSRGLKLTVQFRVANLFNEVRPLYYDTVLRPPHGDLTNPSRVSTPRAFAFETPRSYSVSTTVEY